ncbi:MAG TPA: ABC transporter ATP-binding protein [Pyrinomonadaceae bacterium]|nr:ABC transporter ATP-binding protein [Pyrinomonadaceae bacterium]
MPDALAVVDLRKSFAAPNGERIEVLRGVTLTVKPGESVAITGASGSGKSTLLHLVGGLEEPDHGSLTAFRRERIGFVFQFHYLLPDLTALENVALPLLIQRKNATALQQATELLAEAGLRERLDHPISHLSGGEQQRVAVARALVTQPELVLADEPTGNLDAAIGDEISRTLVSYAKSRSAMVVIATHSLTLAQLCDRVMVLEGGRLSLK